MPFRYETGGLIRKLERKERNRVNNEEIRI